MKILRKGRHYRNQYVGRVILCRDCKSILQVQAKDLKDGGRELIDKKYDWCVHCPVCLINLLIKARTLCVPNDVLNYLAEHKAT